MSCAGTAVPVPKMAEEKKAVAEPPLSPAKSDLKTVVSTQSARGNLLELKSLTVSQLEIEPKPVKKFGPKFSLSAQDVDIKTILLALSKEIDRNIIIDPKISKKATAELKDVSLEEALDGLLHPLDLAYKIRDGFIEVKPRQMETRVFHLNYIISQRRGTSNVQASSGSGISGLGTSSIGSGTSGTSSLGSNFSGGSNFASGGVGQRTSTAVLSFEESNLWREIGFGLKNILGIDETDGGNVGGAQNVSGINNNSGFSANSQVVGGSKTYKRKTKSEDGQETEEELARSYFSINRQSGTIIVKDYPGNLMKVAEFLESVEGSVQRQVFIQAKIIEVELNKNYQLGIDWSEVNPINILNDVPTSPAALALEGAQGFSVGVSNSTINVVVDALSEQGDVQVLSSPKIATLNNQRAIIKVATEDVFFIPQTVAIEGASTTEFIPSTVTIGIVLDVLPQINANGEVMMSINTSISEKVDEKTSPDGRNIIPILDVRESNNVVIAQNGQTIVIGGLMKNKLETNISGVPLLEDIPYVGRVFRKEEDIIEKSELVIMLTPMVMVGRSIDEKRNQERGNFKQFGFPLEPETFDRMFN